MILTVFLIGIMKPNSSAVSLLVNIGLQKVQLNLSKVSTLFVRTFLNAILKRPVNFWGNMIRWVWLPFS